MKPILALNAFDATADAALDDSLRSLLRRRATLFGSASMLFYDRPLEFVRGEGCWLYDADGVAYLDVYNNVASLGHCHPSVIDAAAKQLGELNVNNRYVHAGILDYAEALLATLPAELSNVTFTCTGSESNDLALRLAAHYTDGRGVIVTEAAYHGNTALVTEVSPSLYKQGSVPPHVRLIPAPDGRRVRSGSLSDEVAARVAAAIEDLRHQGIAFSALLIDSIFSSDGVFADPPGFLRAAVDVVHRAGGLLIADEVQAGFGRTGASLWGFERHGVQPDIVTMGKPMGNGYPIGAVVTRPEILDAFCRKVGYFNTFAGSPVAAAVGHAVLRAIDAEGLMHNAQRVGVHLRECLRELALRHPLLNDVRGAGLYTGVEIVEDDGLSPAPERAKYIINGLRDRRVLIGAAGRFGNVLKLRPPLCFSAAHADLVVAALDEVLTAASSGVMG